MTYPILCSYLYVYMYTRTRSRAILFLFKCSGCVVISRGDDVVLNKCIIMDFVYKEQQCIL